MTAADRRKEKAGQDFPLSEKQQIHKSKLITRCAICSVCDLLSLSKGFEASVRCSLLLPPAVIVLPVWPRSAWIKILFPLEICSQVIWFRDCGPSKQVMVQSHITSWSASWSVVFCACFLKTVTTFSLPHSCQQKHPLHTHTHTQTHHHHYRFILSRRPSCILSKLNYIRSQVLKSHLPLS